MEQKICNRRSIFYYTTNYLIECPQKERALERALSSVISTLKIITASGLSYGWL